MKYQYLFLFFLFINTSLYAQTLPANRSVDWTLSGLKNSTSNFPEINMVSEGVVGDGVTTNDNILSSVISANAASGAILIFPNGNFLFNNTINIPSNIIIRGQSANTTTFTMDLNGTGNAINVQGVLTNISTNLTETAIKDATFINVVEASIFNVGDWIHITKDDSSLVTSTWANNSVGQITKITNITSNQIEIESPLRLDLQLTDTPFIKKFDPVSNVGIACLKIIRIDDTAPQQSSNINFNYAINCWVTGIESENCTFSHIKASYSSNLYISKSYMHHAFGYGGGGRAYGVTLQFSTNECLVENNVFERLRHSMLIQAGANGNVFAYNYSTDPHGTESSLPTDSFGDIVLHGNYVFSNLFEQNIVQNIIIDNSHGPNGPHNTFLRNRGENYGIAFSSNNSPGQNFLGNEVTNTAFPTSLVNYTIQGNNHFIHGNNNKGTITPSGTAVLPDISYAYTTKPAFIPIAQWGKIGTQNTLGSASIPAKDRFTSGVINTNSCELNTLGYVDFNISKEVTIFPNPTELSVTVKSNTLIKSLIITNSIGQEIYINSSENSFYEIETKNWESGVYFITIKDINNYIFTKKIVKK